MYRKSFIDVYLSKKFTFDEAKTEVDFALETLFNYTYKDGLQREITVSINNDVQNVLKQLAQCP